MQLSYAQKLAARSLRREAYLVYGALGVACVGGVGLMAATAFAMGIPTFAVGTVFIVICRKIGI